TRTVLSRRRSALGSRRENRAALERTGPGTTGRRHRPRAAARQSEQRPNSPAPPRRAIQAFDGTALGQLITNAPCPGLGSSSRQLRLRNNVVAKLLQVLRIQIPCTKDFGLDVT